MSIVAPQSPKALQTERITDKNQQNLEQKPQR